MPGLEASIQAIRFLGANSVLSEGRSLLNERSAPLAKPMGRYS